MQWSSKGISSWRSLETSTQSSAEYLRKEERRLEAEEERDR
jgi:hypothetical protein